MRGVAARLWLGWLAVGLALLLVPAVQAQSAPGRDTSARLTQPVQSNRLAATSGNKIRATVRKGFFAINAANKKLFACEWGSCVSASKKLRRTARHWLGVLRPMKAETKTVARGLGNARTSLAYWAKTGRDAINADAAHKAKKQAEFNSWYKRYRTHYRLGVKYQNRAVDILSRG